MRGIILANNLAQNIKQIHIEGRGRGEEGGEGKSFGSYWKLWIKITCPLSANLAPGAETDLAWDQDEDTSMC